MSRSVLLAATALAGAALSFPLAPAPAHAADVEAASAVEAVTVYPDGASVTRAVPLRLPAGSHTVILRGLAGSIDPASIRVEGVGTGRLAIGAVDVRAVPGDARAAADPVLEKKIAALKAERGDGARAHRGGGGPAKRRSRPLPRAA